MPIRRAGLAWLLWLAVTSTAAGADSLEAPPVKLKLAIHLHSTVSTGELEPDRILELARQADLDGVVFTDSLLRRWEYGLWPLRSVIKRTVEQPSVFTFGLERYLDTIGRLNAEASGVIALAGVEVAPFYYWRRSPYDRRGGEVRNWNQHLLVFGLGEAGVLRRVPQGEFDPYHGDQGARPYQRLIDYVVARGGLVFWAHPEPNHVSRHGPVEVYTESYPHLLELTRGYHGFALTYRGYLSFADPGGLWDRLLREYCQGGRAHQVWVIGELDWRAPQERPLDYVVTVVSAASRTPAAALEALRQGRMWVVFRIGPRAPALERFEVREESPGSVRISLSGHSGAEEGQRSEVVLVRNGTAWRTETVETTGFELTWTDEAPERPGYYRAIITSPAGLIYTNPIFVQ